MESKVEIARGSEGEIKVKRKSKKAFKQRVKTFDNDVNDAFNNNNNI